MDAKRDDTGRERGGFGWVQVIQDFTDVLGDKSSTTSIPSLLYIYSTDHTYVRRKIVRQRLAPLSLSLSLSLVVRESQHIQEHTRARTHGAFIHFSYITVDIIGCADGKYEHNSTEDYWYFVKITVSHFLFQTYRVLYLPKHRGSHCHLVISLLSQPPSSSLPLLYTPSTTHSTLSLSDDVIS